MKISGTVLAAVAALGLLSGGCISTMYNGQDFPPLPEGVAVAVFRPGAEVPPDTYETIGRLRLSASDGTEESDFYEKLEAEAASRGADAVSVVSFGRELIGQPTLASISESDFEPSSFGGSLNPPSGGGDVELQRYIVVMHAKLLVLKKRYDAEMVRRRQARAEEPSDPKNTGVSRVVMPLNAESADAANLVSESVFPAPGSPGFDPENQAVLSGVAQ